jgi:hypothetical protein
MALDPELKKEFKNLESRIETLVDGLAETTVRGFEDLEMRLSHKIDRLDTKLQNQIDSLGDRKADKTVVDRLGAQVRNFQKR